MAKTDFQKQLEEVLGQKIDGKPENFSYDDWLELFRKVPATRILGAKDWLNKNITVEGFAAASRWIEIIGNPTKMDKLYQGRLKAREKESIMDLAIGDDDEAFYEALIKENVLKLDESRNSAQEVARITQNLNIFRTRLREIRSRKPKKGTVLEKVLELSNMKPESPPKRLKRAKTTKKEQKSNKKKSNSSRIRTKTEQKKKGGKNETNGITITGADSRLPSA